MPKGEFYNLGQSPKRVEAIPMEDKMRYPSIFDLGIDLYPPLKEMKLGEIGQAVIKFKIKGSGIEILAMKEMDGMMEDEPSKRKKAMPMKKETADESALLTGEGGMSE